MPAVFTRFLAGIHSLLTPPTGECLRSDNGTKFTKREFVDRRRICREYTPVDSAENDGEVERRIASTLELAVVYFQEALRLFGGVPLPPRGPLWAEARAYASDVLNMTVQVRDTSDMLTPYQKRYGRVSFPRLLLILKAGFHHARQTILLSLGRTSYTRDVTWLLPATWRGVSPPLLSPPLGSPYPPEGLGAQCELPPPLPPPQLPLPPSLSPPQTLPPQPSSPSPPFLPLRPPPLLSSPQPLPPPSRPLPPPLPPPMSSTQSQQPQSSRRHGGSRFHTALPVSQCHTTRDRRMAMYSGNG